MLIKATILINTEVPYHQFFQASLEETEKLLNKQLAIQSRITIVKVEELNDCCIGYVTNNDTLTAFDFCPKCGTPLKG